MIKFRLFDIDFSLNFTFFAVIAIIEVLSHNLILIFSTSCLIHELGHITAIYLFSGRIKAVNFSGTGIRIIPDKSRYIAEIYEIIILLAGPCANIFFFIFLKIFLPDCENFAILNLSLAIFNLLPFTFLDGGSIISCLLSLLLPDSDNRFILRCIAVFILISCIFASFFTEITISLISVITICCITEIFSD